MAVVDQIFELYRRQGHLSYGEQVSQVSHALQTAHFARADNASVAQIVAALLHDIGHLLEADHSGSVAQGHDARHEDLGHQFLRRHFGPEVTESVLLHVAAKRYLCGTDPSYSLTLSQASLDSLVVQGGPMSPKEIAAFRKNPHFQSAIMLRRWDDLGKEQDFEVAPLESYRELVESCLKD